MSDNGTLGHELVEMNFQQKQRLRHLGFASCTELPKVFTRSSPRFPTGAEDTGTHEQHTNMHNNMHFY